MPRIGRVTANYAATAEFGVTMSRAAPTADRAARYVSARAAAVVAVRAARTARNRIGRLERLRVWVVLAVVAVSVTNLVGFFQFGWPAPKITVLSVLLVAVTAAAVARFVFGVGAATPELDDREGRRDR